MESELAILEEKIHQFVQLCQQLRSENARLRQQLAAATTENRGLMEKIDTAANRLEALLVHIPAGEE
ncbi:hypothetical protein [Nitrosovibrio sp. Nv17]|uniref:hypothetical protein n=1 Tax=Nitrosovibrio sp. Nv17 TaxID=1855339 RepID=UPI0009089ACF|nr:hypothetical protein [Nitrosovibrio sp. Nv17]SFW17852.1 TIGR02449 family protein [Nitrosovibrio sp. Nv17]